MLGAFVYRTSDDLTVDVGDDHSPIEIPTPRAQIAPMEHLMRGRRSPGQTPNEGLSLEPSNHLSVIRETLNEDSSRLTGSPVAMAGCTIFLVTRKVTRRRSKQHSVPRQS